MEAGTARTLRAYEEYLLNGHSSISITMDTYSHVTEGMDREAAERIARMMGGSS